MVSSAATIQVLSFPFIFCLQLASCASAPPPTQNKRDWPNADAKSNKGVSSEGSGETPRFVEKFTILEKGALREAQTLYESGSYDQSLDRLQKLARSNPKIADTPSLQNLNGLNFLGLKRAPEAAAAFQKAAQKSPKNLPQTQYLLYNLATAEFESGQFDQALSTLDEMNPTQMNKINRVKFHLLRGKVSNKKGHFFEASRDILTASSLSSPEASLSFQLSLDQHLSSLKDLSQMSRLLEDFPDSPLADSVLFRLGSLEIVSDSESSGTSHLKDLMTRFPQSKFYAQSQEILRARQKDSPTKSKTIGILLPLQGKFAAFGQRALLGIQLGFRLFNRNEPESPYELVFEDAGEDSQQALKALEKLFFKHQVVAVIGPLLSKGIDQVTQRAQELGLPLLSLSRNEGLRGDYIFQAGLTLRLQAQVMAQFATQELHLKRFAIVFPRDKVGEETAHAFWDALDAFGAEVRGVESYGPTDRDFRNLVDRLSGLYYKDSRQSEVDELAKQREEMQIKKRTRKTEQYFALKPIVDYEAVFIPEEPKLASQIIPTFDYRDVNGIKFLGTAVWNSEEFPPLIQSYGSQIYFLDAFLPRLGTKLNRQFIDKFFSTFQENPTTMEAIAYDAARVLESALQKSGESCSRAQLRDELQKTFGFPGVTGTMSFKNGLLTRDLKILTIRNNRVFPLQKLPLGSE